MIRAIGFDFDGTLIMSEDKKGPAMAAVFREKFGVKRGVQKEYENLIGKGYSRNVKVIKLFKIFLKRKPNEKELKTFADHFGEHYVRKMNACPLFQCTNVIKELRKQVKFTFMLSLENTKEVKKIAKHCGVAKYFDEILGGPTSKIDNFKHVITKHGIKASEVLYIGDAHSDVVASKKMGMKIILLGKKHTFKKLKEDLDADFVFNSLCDMPRKLEKL
jgi:phosphoglycolate phosphatase